MRPCTSGCPAILWLTVAALAACGDSGSGICTGLDCLLPQADAGPSCTRDTDCSLGRICAAGHCTAGCRSSRDCPQGDSCDPLRGAYGTCVRGGGNTPDGGQISAPDASLRADSSTPLPDATFVADAPPPPPPSDAHTGADGCVFTEISLLADGNFDAPGTNPWSASGPAGVGSGQVAAHSSPNLAWIGGTVGSKGILSQGISVPNDVASLTLSGWIWVRTSEAAGAQAYDTVDLRLSAPILGSLVSFGTFSNRDASGGWQHFSFTEFNVLLGLGLGTQLEIEVDNDTTLATTVYVDDLTLTASVCR